MEGMVPDLLHLSIV